MFLAQDDLIDRLGGPDKVAELTGRRKRMVRDADAGTFHYKARAQDMPLNEVPPCFVLIVLHNNSKKKPP